MQHRYPILFAVLFFLLAGSPSQAPAQGRQAAFQVVPLGVRGGLDESNLSAYMVAPEGSDAYICLDAGTLYAGIRKAVDSGVFRAPDGHAAVTISEVLKDYIKAYFISHAHLDHVAGLIINSPDDSPKPVYGLASCLDVLKEKYFTWEAWANFGDAGEKPTLNKYHYSPMDPGQEIAVDHTTLHVTGFPLSHGASVSAGRPVPGNVTSPRQMSNEGPSASTPVAYYESTAFLVRNGEDYLLYLGDTGADSIEHSDKLHRLWQAISPLVKAGRLRAIFIEVSFPDEQPEKLLFGHLTPRLLMQEMKELGKLCGEAALQGLPIVVTHRKPSGNQEALIQKELDGNDPLHLSLVYPVQGRLLKF